MSAEGTTASATPIALTQTLSVLQSAHAHLLEQHGATVASLRQCEANCKREEQRASDAGNVVRKLEADIDILKDQIQKRDQRIQLAEKELRFFRSLAVRVHRYLAVTFVSLIMQASFTAEEMIRDQDVPCADNAKEQQLQEMESLLLEYKSTNDLLMKDLAKLQNASPSPRRMDVTNELPRDIHCELVPEDRLGETLTDMIYGIPTYVFVRWTINILNRSGED